MGNRLHLFMGCAANSHCTEQQSEKKQMIGTIFAIYNVSPLNDHYAETILQTIL